MELPAEPRSGGKLDASWGSQLIRYLRSVALRSSPTVRVSRTPGGVVLSVDGRSRVGFEVAHPFRVSDARDAGAASVTVRFGQVNSVTPAGIGELLPVVSGVVFLKVTLDEDREVISAEIANAAELPANTSTHGHITLATVAVEDDTVTSIDQSVTRSLQHMVCGAKHIWGGL